jgi:hypothetical protein
MKYKIMVHNHRSEEGAYIFSVLTPPGVEMVVNCSEKGFSKQEIRAINKHNIEVWKKLKGK